MPLGAGGFAAIDGAVQFYGRITALTMPSYTVLELGARRGERHDSYQTVVEAYDALPEGRLRTRALAKVWHANRNAYTYLIQDQLGRRCIQDGPRSELLGTKTIQAVARFCQQIEGGAGCLPGPLNRRAMRVLAEHL